MNDNSLSSTSVILILLVMTLFELSALYSVITCLQNKYFSNSEYFCCGVFRYFDSLISMQILHNLNSCLLQTPDTFCRLKPWTMTLNKYHWWHLQYTLTWTWTIKLAFTLSLTSSLFFFHQFCSQLLFVRTFILFPFFI